MKTITYICILTATVFCILIIALLVYLPSPSLLSYLGYADAVTLKNADNLNNSRTMYMIGRLVKDGTLVSLEDIWSFQTSFYQTLITFLIAINALIAAISVIYIKSTSEEKAEETTKKFMESSTFNNMLQLKVHEEAKLMLEEAQNDFNSAVGRLQNIEDVLNQVSILDKRNIELRQQIRVISEYLSNLDSSESEGSDLNIQKKGNNNGVR
ncbi:hypothetical protein [Marinomonas communis]|nr:hypothetical protein [Marinomonas communis]